MTDEEKVEKIKALSEEIKELSKEISEKEKKIMSKVTEFYGAFSKDETMRKRANEAIVAFAKAEGYSFTEEELKDSINSKELSEETLKAVAGGQWTPSDKNRPVFP